jgi:hypothetical protein
MEMNITEEQLDQCEAWIKSWNRNDYTGKTFEGVIELARQGLRLQQADKCDCCTDGKTMSGVPCICKGTGSGEQEKIGLRELVYDQGKQLEASKRDTERLDWLDDDGLIINQLFASADAVKKYWHIYRRQKHYGNGETALLSFRQAIDNAINAERKSE